MKHMCSRAVLEHAMLIGSLLARALFLAAGHDLHAYRGDLSMMRVIRRRAPTGLHAYFYEFDSVMFHAFPRACFVHLTDIRL